MTAMEFNIQQLDAAYRPFPTFEDWQASVRVDEREWDRYVKATKSHNDLSPQALHRARHAATRAAALDTGALEGLYDVDQGFTFTVAFETTAWEHQLAAKGESVRPLFEAQLEAYDYVLDLATKAQPISEAAVRSLQAQVCAAQATYRVITAIGPQEQPLPKGEYKVLPNHVRTRKGVDHSYAPVDVTPAEMYRLVNELRSNVFNSAHPVVQAAYAHYCLVVIHPFSDGNGRVARALASTFTYRAISMPIVILAEQKSQYLDSLEAADAGQYQSFVDFMLARSIDTIRLVEESLRNVSTASLEERKAEIQRLYFTHGGYKEEEVEKAGQLLCEAVFKTLFVELSKLMTSEISGRADLPVSDYVVPDPAFRQPQSGGREILIDLKSASPATAHLQRSFVLWVPRNANGEDELQLREISSGDSFTARVEELIPKISAVLGIRISLFTERLLSEMLEQLRREATRSMMESRGL